MIHVDDRVVIQTIDGELHGVVVAERDTTMLEFNPPAEPNPNKEPLPITQTPVNLDRIVTVYSVLVDGEQAPREVYQFIRPENDTTIQP